MKAPVPIRDALDAYLNRDAFSAYLGFMSTVAAAGSVAPPTSACVDRTGDAIADAVTEATAKARPSAYRGLTGVWC